jgi:ring-1,2-phenylacetyl-CoA epoxidase subunit PaaE
VTGPHFHALRVAGVEPVAADAVAVSFDLPAESEQVFRFWPGQYLTLRHGDLRRAYSICSAPGQPLRVGIRLLPGGAFSGWLHRELKVGDTIDVMTPEGRFGAALGRRPHHLLAVAGGSGITPILSVITAALASDPGCRCTLVYANRSMASMMFRDELNDLKDRALSRLAIHLVFSREAADLPLHAGRIDAAKLDTVMRLAGPIDEAFVCGPYAMNDAVETALREAGLPGARIHVERFGLPPEVVAATAQAPHPEDAASARIRIVRDGVGREIDFLTSDPNILSAAVRSGLDAPYSCRSGMCATCRAKLIEGRVRMDRNYALEPADLEAGFVLTCQAHPLTGRVVLSFDER